MGTAQTKPEEARAPPTPPRTPTLPASDQPELPAMLPVDMLHLSKLHQESRTPDYSVWDVFFWRDAPDWYYRTFVSAGFMFSFSALRLYWDRDQLEVFLPPRAKVLPESLRRSLRNREILKLAVLKTGMQTTVAAFTAGIFFAGAYYLGRYRERHTWTNFTASGAAAGTAIALWMIWPPRVRTTLFGTALGAGLGSMAAYPVEALGLPYWDERGDFEGWWLGRYVDLKRERREREQQVSQAQQQQRGESNCRAFMLKG